jgi:PAS domain S-box-containing protein
VNEDKQGREERLRLAVENAGDVIIVLSTQGEIVEFNAAAERFFGVSRESVLGKEYLARFVPQEEQAASREDAKRTLAGLPLRGRLRPVTVDGRPRFLSWNVDRFLDSSGRPAGVVACGRDVTQQKELEDRVLIGIATGISASTGQELFRHLAGRLMEILEADYVTIGKLEGKRHLRTIACFADGVVAEDTTYDLEGSPCDLVVAGRVCSFAEGVKNLFPGDPILMEWGVEGYVGAPLFDSSEQVQGLVNAFFKAPIRDVSLAESIVRIFAARASGELERLVAVEELRTSEQLKRRIIEAIPGGVVQAAPDGSIVLANEQARQFLHLTYDGPSGRYGDQLFELAFVTEDGASCPRDEGPFNRCLATGLPEPPRVMGIRGPDGIRWGIFTAVPLGSASRGSLEGAVLMFVDITDRKKAEEERRSLEAQMQHAQKLESLGVLAGGIAHDFNNLLTGILGNVSLAMRKLRPGSDLTTTLGRVEQAAERAAELTSQMLAYAGKGSFDVGSLDLNLLVRELLPLLRSSVTKNARLELEFDPGIAEIDGDRSQIEQVVMNLITNASDALEGKEGVIRLRTSSVASSILLEVSDTGSGMNEDTKARIFDPFFTTKFTGRGLGLAAVQGIVRSHYGRIQVESEPGKGTSFTVVFPEGRKPKLGVEVPARPREIRGAGKVLIIDDEEAVREVARAALESAGYHVSVAEDGLQGLNVFAASPAEFVCVLVDVSMPWMNGGEAFRALRAVDPFVPILVTSGFTERETRERFAGSDASGFIQKPFRATDLADKVSRLRRARRSSCDSRRERGGPQSRAPGTDP